MPVRDSSLVDDIVAAPASSSISELAAAYRRGDLRVTDVVEDVLARIAECGDDGTWISVADRFELLARASHLESDPDRTVLPLYGIPFAVKDSIDVAGWPTTLACPGYAYVAERTAPVVQRLLDAGAIMILSLIHI